MTQGEVRGRREPTAMKAHNEFGARGRRHDPSVWPNPRKCRGHPLRKLEQTRGNSSPPRQSPAIMP